MIKEIIYAWDSEVPKVDYVGELVRCSECKHWTYHKRLDVNWCRTLHTGMKADDFCSYAERRTK